MNRYELTNANSLRLVATDFGATITELHAPDREGELADITLGFDDLAQYATESPYFGCIVGRCANRIAGGRFTLDGESYELPINNGPNHLHGGLVGFDKHRWSTELTTTERGRGLRFSLTSEHGDQGYPGTLDAKVTYVLTDDDELIIEMHATTDRPTLCNLAQHAYWNLGGHASGTVAEHVLQLHASRYTPVDSDMIPTGELATVEGTALDFREPKPIGRDLFEVGGDAPGYDHNFVIDGDAGTLRPVARVVHPASGRVMELATDQPGVQLYTANFLDGKPRGKAGASYGPHTGFCLETQLFPDAINQPAWPTPILRPGGTYSHTMVFRFGTE